jgi:RHS repeat-associated protein
LVNAATGTVTANYEYSPFGELIRATGPMAKLNPFMFSTKFYDWETGLYYYGYRYYNPSTGRWPSRDPIGERGGVNLYTFVKNSPLSWVDILGRLSAIQFGALTDSGCGAFSVNWVLALDQPARADGVIVQEITFEYRATGAFDQVIQESVKYWEALPVAANAPAPNNIWDTWSIPSSTGYNGSETMSANAKFYENPNNVLGIIPPVWITGQTWGGSPPYSLESGSLPPTLSAGSFYSTGQQPGFWGNQPVEQGGARSVTVTWKCRCPLIGSDQITINN